MILFTLILTISNYSSAGSARAVQVHDIPSLEDCQRAGRELASPDMHWERTRWTCVKQVTAPEVPQ